MDMEKPRFVLPVAARIELRLLGEENAAQLFALIEGNRAHLREWLPWVDYETTVEDSQRFVTRSVQRYLDNEGFDMGIHYQDQLAGVISFHTVNWPNRQVEIGYWLGAAFQGHGIVTGACRTMLEYAFRSLQLNRVTILCAVGNVRSRAIPERLGFTQEGIIRDGQWLYDRFVDLVMYSMLAREWDALAPAS
ncbi:MAG TPA: GNAT family protein [Ktedonobacteraceae bacterium]|nr:GNAT family protein [Ktedonobacteraceae bacterium]